MSIKRWLTGIGVIAFLSMPSMVMADSADTLDLHSNVKAAYGIADVSSAVCAEVDASGNLQVEDTAVGTDLAAIEVLITASNVDLAAIEVLLGTMDADTGACATDLAAIEVLITAGNVDLDALETLVTAGNVDLAAMEALLITMDVDTDACATDLAAIEVLITASNVDLDAIETLITASNVDLDAIETLITAGNVDLAAMEVDIAAIEVLNTAIQAAVETVPAKTGVVETGDLQVKATAGTVYAVLVSGIGVTAGDKIELENSPTAGLGDALFTVVADAANGTWAFYPCVGVTFDSGIWYDETKSGGTFTTTVVYE